MSPQWFSNLPVHAVLFWVLVSIVALWSLVWKGLALWRAGRNGQPVWFIFLLVLNTAGILPIIYLIFFSKKE